MVVNQIRRSGVPPFGRFNWGGMPSGDVDSQICVSPVEIEFMQVTQSHYWSGLG
jgi:hypothetical protein